MIPPHSKPAGRRASRAFTLVEVIASIVIIGTLGGLAGSVLVRGIEGYRGVAVQSLLHADVASALDRVDRALREIPSLTGDGTPSIKSVTPTSIEWDEANGGAKVLLDTDSLLIGFGGGDGTAILTGMTGMTIQCYDESNAALAATLDASGAAAIRRVEFSITASREGLSDTLRTRVFLRCTMQEGAP